MTDKTKSPRVWVAITHNNRQAVLAGLRGPTCRNPNTWNLFGGSIDRGETPVQAAAREVFEETGIKIKPRHLKLLFTAQIRDKVAFWFTVDIKKVKKDMLRITDEVVDYEWVTRMKWEGRNDLHYSLDTYFRHLSRTERHAA